MYEVGKAYLFRCITFFQLGKVVEVGEQEIKLKDASWVAETARFTQCIENGDLNEVEPVTCEMLVNRRNVIDACVWRHPLPREQK